jgi:hypothetical protein
VVSVGSRVAPSARKGKSSAVLVMSRKSEQRPNKFLAFK